MSNQPSIPLPPKNLTGSEKQGNAQDSGAAGPGHGAVSPRRSAADRGPGELHPVDRVAGRGADDRGGGADWTRAWTRPSRAICTRWEPWPRCTRLCACPTRAALSLPRAWSGCGWCAISQTEPFMVAEVETLEDVEPAATLERGSAGAQRDWRSSSRLSPSRRRSPTSCGPLPPTSRSRAGWWILWPPRCPS